MNSAVENWEDEVKKHSDLRAVCLRGPTADKWDKLKGNGIFIINFEALRFMLSKKVPAKGDKMRMVPDLAKINALLKHNLDMLIIDESHLIKSNGSLNFKLITALRPHIDTRLLMTGTPFGNTLLDVWSQYFIVDHGLTFGRSFYHNFRNVHFEDKGFWGPDYRVTKKGKAAIEEKLFNRAIRYREDECNELPAKVYRSVKYKLGAGQQAEYDLAYKGLDAAGGSIENKSMVFRQICGGTIKQTGKIFKTNPKLDAVKDTVSMILEKGRKAVIFYEFRLEFEVLKKMLKSIKVHKFNVINGDTKDPHHEYTTFNEDDEYRIILVHPKAGGASINLVGGNYCLVYSNGGSVIARKQLEKRIHRATQKRRCFFYDFIGVDTVEGPMLASLKSGKDFFTQVMDKDTLKRMVRGG